MIGYFENFNPTYGDRRDAQAVARAGVFRPADVRGGIGADYLLGGASCGAVRIVDLSHLREPVSLELHGARAGVISDGIDTIVFQGIEEIILPRKQFAAMRASLRVCSDHGVRLSAAADDAAPEVQSAAR